MYDLLDSRSEYGKSKLEEKTLPDHPMKLFEKWLSEAFEADLPEPTAMTLSTCNSQGRVASRIVLLKGFEDNSFHFYSNYKSRKGADLEDNRFAAIGFFWPELERQVRIEGEVKKIPAKDSDLYHAARPRMNQLGAWASDQSTPVKDRYTLEAQYTAVVKSYENVKIIPRPPHWGGYRLQATLIEFWQGRPGRLHDRIEFYKDEEGDWLRRRLNP